MKTLYLAFILMFSISAHASEDCNRLLSDYISSAIQNLAELRFELDLKIAKGESNVVSEALEKAFLNKRIEILGYDQALSAQSLDHELQKRIQTIQTQNQTDAVESVLHAAALEKRIEETKFSNESVGNLLSPRVGHKSFLTPDGKIMSVGGRTTALQRESGTTVVEVFDLQTQQSKFFKSLSLPSSNVNVIPLKNGNVYFHRDLDRAGNEGLELIDFGMEKGGTSTIALEKYARVFAFGERQFVMFGERDGFSIYDVDQNDYQVYGQFEGRSSQVVTALGDGRVFVYGGFIPISQWIPAIQLIDPMQKRSDELGRLSDLRMNHSQLAIDPNTVLFTGGRMQVRGEPVTSIGRYDIAAKKFTEIGNLAVARVFHKSVLLLDGRILTIGGKGANGDVLTSYEVFDPEMGVSHVFGSLSGSRNAFEVVITSEEELYLTGGYGEDFNPTNQIERIKIGKR